jgi:hypothetical protein
MGGSSGLTGNGQRGLEGMQEVFLMDCGFIFRLGFSFGGKPEKINLTTI